MTLPETQPARKPEALISKPNLFHLHNQSSVQHLLETQRRIRHSLSSQWALSSEQFCTQNLLRVQPFGSCSVRVLSREGAPELHLKFSWFSNNAGLNAPFNSWSLGPKYPYCPFINVFREIFFLYANHIFCVVWSMYLICNVARNRSHLLHLSSLTVFTSFPFSSPWPRTWPR